MKGRVQQGKLGPPSIPRPLQFRLQLPLKRDHIRFRRPITRFVQIHSQTAHFIDVPIPARAVAENDPAASERPRFGDGVESDLEFSGRFERIQCAGIIEILGVIPGKRRSLGSWEVPVDSCP